MRVLIKTKDIIEGQTLAGGVDRFRACVRELFDTGDGRKAAESLAGGHPPFTCTVLQSDLITTPTEVGNLFWKSGPNGSESPAVKPIDVMHGAAADHTEFACPVLTNGINSGSGQAV